MELDLRGVPCPLNFARTKLKLDRLAPGERLQVYLDPGEPMAMVPPGIEKAGHHLLGCDLHPDGYYILEIQRGRPL
jgi:TusA-related sulfurtransferase